MSRPMLNLRGLTPLQYRKGVLHAADTQNDRKKSSRMRLTKAACLIALVFSSSASGGDFLRELLTPSSGEHASPNGTPYVHSFFVEPAYLDRDLLIDYRFGYGFDGDTDEQELEFELEWAFTERFGMVLEAPVVGLNPEIGPSESGFGDLAVGGRLLLVDRPCLLVSSLLEIELPTGNEDRGLGRGEAVLAPFVLWWMDLGNWTTFQGQFGPEIALESGETELLYLLSLNHSWQGPVVFSSACCCCPGHRRHNTRVFHSDDEHGDEGFHTDESHNHDDHSHHSPGLVTLYLETTGVTSLTDPDEGTRFEIVPGIGYTLTEEWEIRFAGRFPLFKPARMHSQYILSTVRHF